MGTSYVLYEDEKVEVSLDEMSNKLSLNNWYSTPSVEEVMLEPKDMLKLLLKGVTATSYWMSEKEFKEVFDKLEVYPY